MKSHELLIEVNRFRNRKLEQLIFTESLKLNVDMDPCMCVSLLLCELNTHKHICTRTNPLACTHTIWDWCEVIARKQMCLLKLFMEILIL